MPQNTYNDQISRCWPGLGDGNSPVTGEVPTQGPVTRTFFIWWRHHDKWNTAHWLCSWFTLFCVLLWLITASWWRHQMETFSALLAICAGNSPVPGEFPTQRPVTRSFDVFFDLRLNKQLTKKSWGWWFETLSGSLWRQCNDNFIFVIQGFM